MRASIGLGLWVVLLSAACGSSEDEGSASGAACNEQLTYEADVAPLVGRYCLSCHSSSVPLEQRQGAPGDHDFDTEQDLVEHLPHIDRAAGAGPLAVNESMPPQTARQPSIEERETLASWLACQTTQSAHQHEAGHSHSH